MEIKIKREKSTNKSTSGVLTVNDMFECYTLEDTERDLSSCSNKVPGKTCVPKGRYEVILSYSNRFHKFLPLLINVPCFEGIRIHGGNKAEDTEGCILVGTDKVDDGITSSQMALRKLISKIKEVQKQEKIFIQIS